MTPSLSPQDMPPAGEENVLRCKKCDTPLNPKTAIWVEHGYQCKHCITRHQQKFENAKPQDYLLGISAHLILFCLFNLVFLGGLLLVFSLPYVYLVMTAMGILAFMSFSAKVMARVVQRIIHRRRSQRLFHTVKIASLFAGVSLFLASVAVFFYTPTFASALLLIGQLAFAYLVPQFVHDRLTKIDMRD